MSSLGIVQHRQTSITCLDTGDRAQSHRILNPSVSDGVTIIRERELFTFLSLFCFLLTSTTRIVKLSATRRQLTVTIPWRSMKVVGHYSI